MSDDISILAVLADRDSSANSAAALIRISILAVLADRDCAVLYAESTGRVFQSSRSLRTATRQGRGPDGPLVTFQSSRSLRTATLKGLLIRP